MTPEDKPASTVKVQKELHQKWVDEIPAAAAAQRSALENEPDTEDLIEDFLTEISNDQSCMLEIYRLPNFSRDGRTGLRLAQRTFVDRFPFGESNLASYKKDIQVAYGGGMYQLTLRNETGQIMKRWTESIENPPPPPQIGSGQPQQTYQPPHYASDVQVIQPLSESLKALRELAAVDKILKQIRGEDDHRPVSATAPSPDAQINPQVEAVNVQVELARAIIGLAKDSEPIATRLLDSVFPGAKESKSGNGVWDIVGSVLERVLPPLADRVLMIMAQPRPGQQPPRAPAPNPAGHRPGGSAAPRVPEPPPQPQPDAVQTMMITPHPFIGEGQTCRFCPLPPHHEIHGNRQASAFAGESQEQHIDYGFQSVPKEETTEMVEGEEPAPYFDLFDALIAEIARQAPAQRGAELVREFAADFGEYVGYIQALLLSPPASILAFLAMLSPDYARVGDIPNAAHYLEQLQELLKGGHTRDS